MKRKAFLEKNITKEWMDDFVYISRQPLSDLGFEIVPFIEGTLNQHSPTKNDMIVGGVDSTVDFFKMIDVKAPSYLGYPECLKKYLGRQIEKRKVKDLSDLKFPYFIKPAHDVKRFTGSVIEKQSYIETLKAYDGVTDEDEVYVSSLIDIKSEYRCFVHKGVLKGIRYYSGDFKIFPNVNMLEFMIIDYEGSKEAPVSYTLDVAILADGSTALIEVNDMWAIGSYGLDGKTYARLAVDRFYEIVNEKNAEDRRLR